MRWLRGWNWCAGLRSGLRDPEVKIRALGRGWGRFCRIFDWGCKAVKHYWAATRSLNPDQDRASRRAVMSSAIGQSLRQSGANVVTELEERKQLAAWFAVSEPSNCNDAHRLWVGRCFWIDFTLILGCDLGVVDVVIEGLFQSIMPYKDIKFAFPKAQCRFLLTNPPHAHYT